MRAVSHLSNVPRNHLEPTSTYRTSISTRISTSVALTRLVIIHDCIYASEIVVIGFLNFYFVVPVPEGPDHIRRDPAFHCKLFHIYVGPWGFDGFLGGILVLSGFCCLNVYGLKFSPKMTRKTQEYRVRF